MHQKRIKYQGINLPKDTKNLYSENCKTLMEEIKEDINRWEDTPYFWTARINIVEMTVVPKAIYRFSTIPIKLPITFFTELDQKNLKICMETQKIPNSQSKLKKRSWRNQAPWLSYKAAVFKTVWYWHKTRNIDQWNRIQNAEIIPFTYGQLIDDKGGMLERQSLQQMVLGKLDSHMWKKKKRK